jgi:arginase
MPEPVVLAGVPWDEQSSFMRGAAEAPAAIRRALASPSSNLAAEDGLELTLGGNLIDGGNLILPAADASVVAAAISDGAARYLAEGRTLLALGGDHAVTFPLVRAHAGRFPRLNILHLDAHPDLYDDFDGRPFSHASPFARIMEAGLAARLVQVGIRTLNTAQRGQVQRFGVEQVHMRDWTGRERFTFAGPVYLSLDLDVLDPAFAPGVSHHEPGGLSVREVVRLIHEFEGELIGADIVELNPARDRDGVTAMVAAKLVKEIASRMLRRAPALG